MSYDSLTSLIRKKIETSRRICFLCSSRVFLTKVNLNDVVSLELTFVKKQSFSFYALKVMPKKHFTALLRYPSCHMVATFINLV